MARLLTVKEIWLLSKWFTLMFSFENYQGYLRYNQDIFKQELAQLHKIIHTGVCYMFLLWKGFNRYWNMIAHKVIQANVFIWKVQGYTRKWYYGKCSKILNTSCLSKRARQIEQTQIRLLLKKQSDQGLPCLLFKWPSVNSSPNNQHFIWKQKEESVWNFRTVTVQDNQDIFQASSCPLAQDNTYRRRVVWERV